MFDSTKLPLQVMLYYVVGLKVTVSVIQVLDTRDNPELGMPPKPTEQLTGSGTELYNIDFDPIKLKEGAVVSQSTLLPSMLLIVGINIFLVRYCFSFFLTEEREDY